MCRNFRLKHFCISRNTNKIASHAIKQFLQTVHHLRFRSYAGYAKTSYIYTRPYHQTDQQKKCWIGSPFSFATAARRFFHCSMVFLILAVWCRCHAMCLWWHSDLWCSQTAHAFLHRQVLARYPKLNNVAEFKSVECDVHSCELMKSSVLCWKKIWVALMLCDETLSLHNWIFNLSYVIKRHSVVSLVKSLKFITE